ncbi:MAG: hypothetical protein JST11_12190 [Acidobacteria bacterium]|nr:hypothetical protein [Acidobacteriota bacterium]
MYGHYLATKIESRLIGPITAFREYVFRDVLPAFGNLNERACQLASDYYHRAGSMQAGPDDIDMSDVAEDAQEHAHDWYAMMVSLQQTMRNLLAAGLFHMAEQQLAMLCRDARFPVAPPHDTKLAVVNRWYKANLRLDLMTLPSWNILDELRLVANVVKHGAGASANELQSMRPELFRNPDLQVFYDKVGENTILLRRGEVVAPLAGEDLFVTEADLRRYAEGTERFFIEIADHLRSRPDECY